MSIKNKIINNSAFYRMVFVSTFFLFLFSFTPNVYADYADGTGQGKLQNQIYWLDWQGFTFANGQSKTFNLPGGVVITAAVSAVSGGTISAGRPEDYQPAAMNRAYPNTGHTAIKSCNACTNKFTMSFTASVDGLSIPVDLVAADAEAAASNEYMKMTTNGEPWRLLEQFDAHNLRASWTNSDKTLELHGNGHTPYGTVLAVSTNVTSFNFEIKGGGISAAALGVFLPFDYGDAPSSLGEAGNYIRQTYIGGEPGSQKIYDPATTFTNFANIADSSDLYLGHIKPDGDPGTQNSQVNAVGDNNDGNNDEEAVSSFPQLVAGDYTVNVDVYNTGNVANLYGWIDFNSDGIFQTSEAAATTVNSTSTIALTWNAINPTLLPGTPVYARFRLTRTNLTDSGGTAKDERAEGGAGDGEVEDYAILPPVASPDAYSVAEDGTLTVTATTTSGVLANDHDPASKPLTAILVTDVSNGSLTLNADGGFTYVPTIHTSIPDSFEYKANDGSRDSNTVTVSITVNHVNHPPTATPDAYTTPEDAVLNVTVAKSVLKNDSDIDVHDQLSAIIVSDPSNGSVTLNADGTFSYTPTANYNGPDSFTYKVNDGHADSNTVTVSLIITAVNDAPVAAPDGYSIAEDTTLHNVYVSVLRNDRDPEANHLTAIKVTDPAHGAVTFQTDGFFTYTPDANFNGADSFTYKANDGQLDSNVATVFINVTTVNDPPIANGDGYSVHEDTGLTIDAVRGVLKNDSDIDLNILTVILDNGVSNGTLHLNKNGSFDYTPNTDFNGVDSFTYHVNDGHSNSNIVTVQLTVDAINDKPLAHTDLYAIPEDTVLQVDIAHGLLKNDTDVDGDTLYIIPVTLPADGTISLDPLGGFIYIPDSNFNGIDSFEYKANDGKLDSDPVTVFIEVNPINDAPLATDDSYNTPEDTPLIINIANGILANDSDIDGNLLHVLLVPGGGPAHGTIHVNIFNGSFTYTPDSNFNGIDTFTYWARDAQLNSNMAIVTINVHAVNDAPTATADSYSVGENGFLNVTLNSAVLGNDHDIDGNTLLLNLGTIQVTDGTLQMNRDGRFTYKPNSGFYGIDTFNYKATDGALDSNEVIVTITVNHINHPTLPNTDSYTITQDSLLKVTAANGLLANDLDIDGDTLLVTNISAGVSHGFLQMNLDGSFTYSPDPGYSGPDSFSYIVNDGTVDSAPVIVNLTVTHTNHVPLAGNDVFNLSQNSVLNVPASGLLANDLDIDGDQLFVLVQSQPKHGALHQDLDGGLSYLPAHDFEGTDSYTYLASDRILDSNIVTVTLNVHHSNHPPLAQGDSYSTARNAVLQVSAAQGVLNNDSDPEANSITPIIVSQTQHGLLHMEKDGSFKYTPDTDYAGLDSFSYKVSDGSVESNLVNVIINVNFTNRAPVAADDNYSIASDTLLQASATNGLLLNDNDPDGDVLQAIIIAQPLHGNLHLLPDGGFTYQPDSGYAGSDSFTYKDNDGHSDSNTAIVLIDVHAINNPPVVNPSIYTVTPNIPLQIGVPGGVLANAKDPDKNLIHAIVVIGPANGKVHLKHDGSFTYTPNPGFTGKDKFFVKGTDNHSKSVQTAITLNVTQSLTPAPAQPIPTLNQWMQILLAVLLFGMARYSIAIKIQQRNN